MCGIFGAIVGEQSTISPALFRSTVTTLFKLSETRGKESSGFAILDGGPINVYKQPLPASVIVRTKGFKTLLDQTLAAGNGACHSVALIGHSRLVTNGAQENNLNNQPVIAGGLVGIHNGIITNDSQLWDRFPDLKRISEVDTEVLLQIIRKLYRENGSLIEAVRAAFGLIQGNASVAILFEDLNYLLLATNNGSLYRIDGEETGMFVFASENLILDQLIAKTGMSGHIGKHTITRIEPGKACLVDLKSLAIQDFPLNGATAPVMENVPPAAQREIRDCSLEFGTEFPAKRVKAYYVDINPGRDNAKLLFEAEDAISKLKRCSRCVLPESYPGIDFDADGVCRYCRHPRIVTTKGPQALDQLLEQYRRTDGKPDIIVCASGGRDSTYGLHYAKNVLKMNPVAYTYDWGMVTDLARRNIARVCGKLGIEHILVSADISEKRLNIRRNVRAWIKNPDLGVIPLFMAGDKEYFHHAYKLREQLKIDPILMSSGSGFEDADFKFRFAGVNNHSSGLANKIRLAAYYAGQFARNPAYINRSIPDTISAYYYYYFVRGNHLRLFTYVQWDEDEIHRLLAEEYDWERATDTKSTWRIGDGTASFYNYIYWTVAGFTENDTFRSHQIRHGMMDREKALEKIRIENAPRYESIKWYLDINNIGIPFDDVIKRINAIPKHYGER